MNGVTQNKQPELSVILVTPNGGASIAKIVRHLHAQTIRDRIELIVVAPPDADVEIAPDVAADFQRVHAVEIPEVQTTATARSAGVRHATAPVIALVEDHSFPETGWAEALVGAHREDYAAVGPRMCNANPKTLTSWANLLIEYGPWMAEEKPTEMEHLAGHNCSYKRDLLESYGAELGAMLESESILHWDLRKRGFRLLYEPAARVRHLNYSLFADSMALRWCGGRAFAASRSAQWPLLRRLLFAGAAPLIPWVRLLRTLRVVAKMPELRPMLGRLVPMLTLLLATDGFGEGVGYLLGTGAVRPRLTGLELHRERHLNAGDRPMAFV